MWVENNQPLQSQQTNSNNFSSLNQKIAAKYFLITVELNAFIYANKRVAVHGQIRTSVFLSVHSRIQNNNNNNDNNKERQQQGSTTNELPLDWKNSTGSPRPVLLLPTHQTTSIQLQGDYIMGLWYMGHCEGEGVHKWHCVCVHFTYIQSWVEVDIFNTLNIF